MSMKCICQVTEVSKCKEMTMVIQQYRHKDTDLMRSYFHCLVLHSKLVKDLDVTRIDAEYQLELCFSSSPSLSGS
jgi:hypothetical protein